MIVFPLDRSNLIDVITKIFIQLYSFLWFKVFQLTIARMNFCCKE